MTTFCDSFLERYTCAHSILFFYFCCSSQLFSFSFLSYRHVTSVKILFHNSNETEKLGKKLYPLILLQPTKKIG